MRGGEGNAAWQRCEERRILRLLEMTLRMLGKAGLNVTTNGILLDSFLVDVSRALLRGIWRTLSISSLMKRYWTHGEEKLNDFITYFHLDLYFIEHC